MRQSVAGGVMEVRPWVSVPGVLAGVCFLAVPVTLGRLIWMLATGNEMAAGYVMTSGLVLPVVVWQGIALRGTEDSVLVADRRRECLVFETGDRVSGFRQRVDLKDIGKIEVKAVIPWVWYRAVVIHRNGFEMDVPILHGVGRRSLNRLVERIRVDRKSVV